MLRTQLRYLTLLCLSALLLAALLLAGCAPMSLQPSSPAQLLQSPVVEAPMIEVAMGEAVEADPASASVSTTVCPVTQTFQDQPPDDPNADPFGFGNWHINADRTLWVGIPPSGVWHTGGEKVIWIRPAGTELVISGQRLDVEAEPLRVEAPCCYPTGFEVNGLYFPTEGCWEVIATAGEHELHFVIEVVGGEENAKGQRTQRDIDPTSPLAGSVLLQRCTRVDCELQVFDTETGALADDFAPLDLGRYATLGASNDLTQLAVIAYDDNNRLTHGRLTFIDLTSWKSITTSLIFHGAYSAPRFTHDNTRLLVVTQEDVWPSNGIFHLVDVANSSLLAEQPVDFFPQNFQLTADGSGLMVFGSNGTDSVSGTNTKSHIALLDATTLEVIWQEEVEGLLNGQVMAEGSTDFLDSFIWQPASAFATDKATLYIVHADQEQLTTVDFSAAEDYLKRHHPATFLDRTFAHADSADCLCQDGKWRHKTDHALTRRRTALCGRHKLPR